MNIHIDIQSPPGSVHTAFLMGNTIDRDGRKILAHACYKPDDGPLSAALELARNFTAKSRRIGRGPIWWQRFWMAQHIIRKIVRHGL